MTFDLTTCLTELICYISHGPYLQYVKTVYPNRALNSEMVCRLSTFHVENIDADADAANRNVEDVPN